MSPSFMRCRQRYVIWTVDRQAFLDSCHAREYEGFDVIENKELPDGSWYLIEREYVNGSRNT